MLSSCYLGLPPASIWDVPHHLASGSMVHIQLWHSCHPAVNCRRRPLRNLLPKQGRESSISCWWSPENWCPFCQVCLFPVVSRIAACCVDAAAMPSWTTEEHHLFLADQGPGQDYCPSSRWIQVITVAGPDNCSSLVQPVFGVFGFTSTYWLYSHPQIGYFIGF